MASTSLNESNLEKRLQTVSNTQESIQSLSLWCLHHKSHFKKIIDIWIKVLKKAKVSHRLALFYLANDVIQNSRRKGCPQFSEAWQPMIKQAIPYVSDDKIRIQIERILNIWEDRNVYEAQFIGEMHKVISSNQPKQTEQVAAEAKLLVDFKPQKLADKIRKYRKLEADVDAKQKHFSGLKMDVCNTETLKQLKDKAHGTKFSKDFDDATTKLDEFVTVMQKSVKDRGAVIEMLEQSEAFYEVQKKEAKIVANAYKNFGNRVKNLQTKLKEFVPNLPSPVPSLNADAPSPLDSSDGETTTADRTGDATKDDTEAVDMEMSDDDSFNASSQTNNKDADGTAAAAVAAAAASLSCEDIPSPPGSAPSPDGSPVGLNLSPAAATAPVQPLLSTAESPVAPSPARISTTDARHSAVAAVKVSTASSILASITKNSNSSSLSASASQRAKNNASSLDIRLSNLMQSIPNFTSSFFGGRVALDGMAGGTGGATTTTTSASSEKNSPAATGTDKTEEGGTPLKDEESGTGSATPLQDESRAGEARKAATTAASAAQPSGIAVTGGYDATDNGGDSTFYTSPMWSAASTEPPSTSNNIVDILQKLASGTALKGTSASGWIPVPPTPPEQLTSINRSWYEQQTPFDGFSPDGLGASASYPYDPEIQFPPDLIMNGLDDISLPDEMPRQQQQQPGTLGGYRRNSNIVELTPSPAGSPNFDSVVPQTSCNSRNLITIVHHSTGGQDSRQVSPPLLRQLSGGGHRKLSDHSRGNGEKQSTTASDEDEELYSRIETLDSRRDESPNDGVGAPWNPNNAPPPRLPGYGRHSEPPASGWQQVFPASNPNPPSPRRDLPPQHYGGFGFRFPRGGAPPRRDWPPQGGGGRGSMGNNMHNNAKRPPPPMMPVRNQRWPHSQRRPY